MEENTHNTVVLTDASFKEEVLNFKGLVLVDFWADWCTPCHIMAPRIEELATKLKDNPNVKIAKLNVDENEETSFELRIMSLPTFKLFRNGEVIDEVIGAGPVENIEALVMRNLAPAA